VSLKAIVLSVCPAWFQQYVLRIESSPLGSRLATGVFWSLAGTVISRGLVAVSSIIVARILGREGFGELGIIQSTIGMFGVFAGLGLGLTATKYIAEFRISDPQKAGRVIALSNVVAITSAGLLALGLVFSSSWLAKQTLAAPHLQGLLKIGSLLLLSSAVCGAQTGVLSGFEAFKAIAKVNLWSGIASFLFMVTGVVYAGLKGALWGQILGMFVLWMLNCSALRLAALQAGVPRTMSGWVRELPILWHYSFPALLGSIVVGPVTWACNAILVNRPHGYAEMGMFNAANQWFSLLLLLPAVLSQAALPMLSERIGHNDRVQSSKILVASIKINAAVVLPMVLVGCIFSQFIMSLYGDGFRNGWPTLVLVLVTAGLSSIQSPVGALIQASGKMWTGATMNLGWAIAFLLATILLIGYGSSGLAAARAIAYAIHAVWTFAFAFHITRSMERLTGRFG
jgi:O-antigen/teichoic acid export membrane protein